MTNNRTALWQMYCRQYQIRRSNTRGGSKFSLAQLMPQVPHLGSLVLGILIGIFLTSLLVFAFSTSDITLKIPTGSTLEQRAAIEPVTESGTVAPTAAADITPTQIIAVQEPRFDFYTELTQTSPSEVNEPTIKRPAPIAQPPSKHAAAHQPHVLTLKTNQKTINEYMIQAGSYRRLADADSLKARLALNGLRAKIESNKISNGEVWSKVMLGPVKSEQSAKELQRMLKSLDVDGILILHPTQHQRG